MKKYLINSNICESCGDCLGNCPTRAIDTNGKGEYVIDPTLCIYCDACIESCPVDAIAIEEIEAFKTVGDFNTQFKNCSGFKTYTKKNKEYFVINEELSEMFSLSGAGKVDLTGYDNKKFATSFPVWRSKTPTGGYIAFGITLEGENGINNFDKVSVYCTANTHINYPYGTNYLFKYVHGIDREDRKACYVQFVCPEMAEKDKYRVDISVAVYNANSFWSYNGFKSIFGTSLTPDICKKTGTDYRITSNGLFIIKDDKPLTLLCDEGYGCTI